MVGSWANVKNQFVYEVFELVFENSVDFDGLGLSARLGGGGEMGRSKARVERLGTHQATGANHRARTFGLQGVRSQTHRGL